MLKISKAKKIILAAICTFGLNTSFELPTAQAVYKSHSDTGTETFDYIENRRRRQRARALTDEQKKLRNDINEVKQNLPQPIEKDEPAPIAFEGDDLTYNTLTGEFRAKGHVDVIQVDGHRFQGADISGNINDKEVRVPGKAHVLQLTKNAPRITLDGYNAVYNYGTQEGTMENANGKFDEYYISGKRFEFYPDHIVAYDAYQTKCAAKIPDYRLQAKRMEIWPEQIVRMYDIKLMIGEFVVGSKKYDERVMEDGKQPYFPKVGYNSKQGAYVEDTFEFPMINDHFKTLFNAHIETKHGVRSNSEFHYINRNVAVMALYGYYYDGDGRWIKKEPGLDVIYKKHLDHLPFSYKLEYEVGEWSSIGNTGMKDASTHQEVELGVARDPIHLGSKYYLFLNTSYKITKDKIKRRQRGKNYQKDVRGWNYGIRLAKEFDDRLAAYTAFEYDKKTSQNSLYEFDTDSYSHKFSTGLSYRFTPKDRIVVGWKFDTQRGRLADVDYFWYHDLHCSTAIVRWRQRRDEWELHWQFTPW